ncbi:hypothetical protein EBU99_10395 [bacterium]|nr:hypothetical protein [bacterium]
MNESRFEASLACSWNFLNRYYNRNSSLNIFEFIIYSRDASARVLIDDTSEPDSAFLAIEFPESLRQQLNNSPCPDLHSLSVICEEISHFFHLTDAAEQNLQVSALQLEAWGEIDRFLSFLHWNSFFPHLALQNHFHNCREVCDVLFEQRDFVAENCELYREAESLAFHHLKRAFSHCWSNQQIDCSSVDPRAQNYLRGVVGTGRAFIQIAG